MRRVTQERRAVPFGAPDALFVPLCWGGVERGLGCPVSSDYSASMMNALVRGSPRGRLVSDGHQIKFGSTAMVTCWPS